MVLVVRFNRTHHLNLTGVKMIVMMVVVLLVLLVWCSGGGGGYPNSTRLSTSLPSSSFIQLGLKSKFSILNSLSLRGLIQAADSSIQVGWAADKKFSAQVDACAQHFVPLKKMMRVGFIQLCYV